MMVLSLFRPLGGLLVFLAPLVQGQGAREEVDFARDVQPILEAHCYECHGRNQQKAGLRLDQRAAALLGSSFGKDPVLVAGDLGASRLFELVSSSDRNERMPPSEQAPLDAEELRVLGAWITGGMAWPDDGEVASWPARHWAYQVPQAVEIPELSSFPPEWRAWPRTEVDRFVLQSMLAEGLTPAADAEPGTWLRRASLDLLGLPPTLAELEALDADLMVDRGAGVRKSGDLESGDLESGDLESGDLESGDRWQTQLQRLLASPHYGEQQALRWLDLARYADSNGYEKDETRSIWPYRDWVIDAYNRDLGYDAFTVAQLAGDLLPDATLADRIATGFHRNTMVNDEGGADAEEYRVAAVKDRTDTTAAVWLGSTLACAQCHNHKYDPFSQRDYYEFFAFFNQTADGGKANPPILEVQTERMLAQEAELAERVADLEASLGTSIQRAFVWVGAERPSATSYSGNWDAREGEGEMAARWRSATEYAQFYFEGAEAPLLLFSADRFFVDVWLDPEAPPRELMVQLHVAGGDWEHRAFWGEDAHELGTLGTGSRHRVGDLPALGSWQRLELEPTDGSLRPGTRIDGLALGQVGGRVGFGDAGLWTSNPDPTQPLPVELQRRLDRRGTPASTLVLERVNEPRRTHLLEKGNFQSPGVEVHPGIPAVLQRKRGPRPNDRLELAQWLVSRQNPLAARVEVNRVWQQIFGTGLVTTPEDFGSQGAAPSHPELLDWLAIEFMEHGWSRKWLLSKLLSSSVYLQSSHRSAAANEVDPKNRLLSYFPRLRLSGENLRDQQLVLSGLWDPAIGGPSVFPPQPPGFDAGTYAGDRWRDSEGSDRYRRGLYTFWRRTSPYPSFVLFDATSRELSCARRDRSNTPLQALALLNDPGFAELAQAFGTRIAVLEGENNAVRCALAFLMCTGREPSAEELAVLTELLGATSWSSLARVLFNLDETVNRG